MAILVFEHCDLSGVRRLGATLRDYGHRLDIRRMHRGDTLPHDLDDVQGVIACGGPHSANDTEPAWLVGEMDLLREAHAAGLPVVGICLGCQLLARALGGEVGPLDGGIEFGWHDVRLTDVGKDDPLHAGIPWTSPQFQYHRDAVTTPPPGARVLSRSARCGVQAWAHGLNAYGFQYHPEYDDETIATIMRTEPEVVAEAGLEIARLGADTERLYPTFARLGDRLFEAIALLLMPVDRRYKGLVKDLHH